MKADYRVVLDACVLANHGVCDLLLRLAESPRQFIPVWSKDILEETRRTHVSKLEWPVALADSFQSEVRRAFPHSMAEHYEQLIPTLTNHEKDRHVLAAAIRSGSSLILTFNLKHFPMSSLDPWDLEVVHPDDYLLALYAMAPEQVVSRIAAIAAKRKTDAQDILLRLGKTLPKFAAKLFDGLDLT